MKASCIIDRGIRRGVKKEVCEDHAFYTVNDTKNPTVFAACVCDGVGSLPGSDMAAKFVCGRLKEEVELGSLRTFDKLPSEDQLALLEEIFEKIKHDKWWEDASQPLATTTVLLLMTKENFHIVNIGDSRCYKLKGETFTQVTADQENELGQVISVMGTSGFPMDVDIYDGKLTDIDGFLLCSDGMFKKEDLSKVIPGESPQTNLKYLVKKARNAGEKDDISAIFVSISD